MAIFYGVQSILDGRIKNRPRSHHSIRRRIRFTLFAGISFLGWYSAFFTERLVDARDAGLTFRAPAPSHLSTTTTHRWEEQIQPGPGQSIKAIRPGCTVHSRQYRI